MRSLLVPVLVIAVLAAGGCSRIDLTPLEPSLESTPTVTATEAAPDPEASASPGATQSPVTADGPVIEPLPAPVVASTGPLNLSGGQTAARAKRIIIGSHSLTAIALDGSTMSTWVLPGDLRTLIEGLSYAFGRGPTIISHAPYSWVYDWGGFSVTDFSPSISSPADPPYKVSVTVRSIGVTEFKTVNDLQVGDAASRATAISDEVIDAGYYWASVDSFHVAVPGIAEPRIYLEISAASGTSAITEIRGPTGSWTS